MQIKIHARGSGKNVRIFDRIAGSEAFNSFLDAGDVRSLSVASSDGNTGNIDVYKRMTAENPEYVDRVDYSVTKGETLEIEDV